MVDVVFYVLKYTKNKIRLVKRLIRLCSLFFFLFVGEFHTVLTAPYCIGECIARHVQPPSYAVPEKRSERNHPKNKIKQQQQQQQLNWGSECYT